MTTDFLLFVLVTANALGIFGLGYCQRRIGREEGYFLAQNRIASRNHRQSRNLPLI